MKTLIKVLSVLSVIVLTGCAGMQGTKPATSLKATPVAKATAKEPLNDFLKVIITKADAKAPAALNVVKSCGLTTAVGLTKKHLENLFSSDTKLGLKCFNQVAAYPSKLEAFKSNKSYQPQIDNFKTNQTKILQQLQGFSKLDDKKFDELAKKIEANATSISTNKNAIVENKKATTSNTNKISLLEQEVAKINQKVDANTQGVAKNTKSIDANDKASQKRDSNISETIENGFNSVKNLIEEKLQWFKPEEKPVKDPVAP